MTLNDDVSKRRNRGIERRLHELGATVHGLRQFNADRISDVMDQIDELRELLNAQNKAISELTVRVDRMAAYLNKERDLDTSHDR